MTTDGTPAGTGRVLPDTTTDPRSLRRVEDVRFLTGQGRYVDDAPAAGQPAMAVLRSPHAHAAIRSIDIAAAQDAPGVRGVFTAADLAADGIGPLPCSLDLGPEAGLVVPPRPALCSGQVRHVGDPVAIVIAETRAQAVEALELIGVDYEALPAVVDPREAREPGAPQLWDKAPGNLAFRYRRGDLARTEEALAAADHVVTLELVNSRVAAAALEPRTAIGRWDAVTGQLRLEVSGASVHLIRRELARIFSLPLEAIEVVCPDVGGGFGMKNVTYPEYVLLLWAARRLGAPVRWVADRIDDFSAGVHGRDNLTRARLGLDARGRFLALAVETTANLGAYASSLGPGSATTAPTPAMGGLYPIAHVSMDVEGVFTCTAPVDAYRGAGKPEACYLIERLVDVAAKRLGKDRVALRRLNLIASVPHVTSLGYRIDSGDFRAALAMGLTVADHAGFPRRWAESRRRGLMRGFGIACFLETSRGEPDEQAFIRLADDGTLVLAVGTQSNGQGHETSFVQLVAARLGLPMAAFRYVQADTTQLPRGGSHGGARSLHMGGTALLLATDDLLRQALPLAAGLLQAAEADVTYADGAFRSGTPPRSIDLPGIGRALAQSGSGPRLAGRGDNVCDTYTFPNGCHVAEVEVDPETGTVALLRYCAVDDYGTLVNPLLAEGQIHGGLAQGIGQALMEQVTYDPESGQLASATFMDYAMPRAADVPPFEVRFVEIPTAANPIGAKGAGQAGAIAATPAVINAIVDALAPLGIDHFDMPATPQRVWQAIRDARLSQASAPDAPGSGS